MLQRKNSHFKTSNLLHKMYLTTSIKYFYHIYSGKLYLSHLNRFYHYYFNFEGVESTNPYVNHLYIKIAIKRIIWKIIYITLKTQYNKMSCVLYPWVEFASCKGGFSCFYRSTPVQWATSTWPSTVAQEKQSSFDPLSFWTCLYDCKFRSWCSHVHVIHSVYLRLLKIKLEKQKEENKKYLKIPQWKRWQQSEQYLEKQYIHVTR